MVKHLDQHSLFERIQGEELVRDTFLGALTTNQDLTLPLFSFCAILGKRSRGGQTVRDQRGGAESDTKQGR